MKKILVIEDEPMIRETLQELLEAEGFYTITAENGKQGVEQAQEIAPDMILCDVTMPELDGYGVLATLRQNPDTATIPFIFLTGREEKSDLRQGMQLGADDYLTKPCTSNELLAAITSRFDKQAAFEQQSKKQLEELRGSIAMALPHELRTPLNGILGLAEVLIDEYDSIDRADILDMAEGIHTAAERLYRLIQNFLLYAELEMAAKDPERLKTLHQNGWTYYPKVLIANTATEIAKRANREADLKLELQDAPIYLSDLKLKKVLTELIDNAFKFSTTGTPVEIISIASSSSLVLYVIDYGRGMTTEQIAHAGAYMQFERKFYEQQGTGLGLVIAKRLVELHSGEFTIESIPGQQTIIRIVLPVGKENAPN